MPCGFDDVPESTPTASGWASVAADIPTGVWELTMRINEKTFVTTADVPYYNRALPMSGTKPAREALLAAIKSANGGMTD